MGTFFIGELNPSKNQYQSKLQNVISFRNLEFLSFKWKKILRSISGMEFPLHHLIRHIEIVVILLTPSPPSSSSSLIIGLFLRRENLVEKLKPKFKQKEIL